MSKPYTVKKSKVTVTAFDLKPKTPYPKQHEAGLHAGDGLRHTIQQRTIRENQMHKKMKDEILNVTPANYTGPPQTLNPKPNLEASQNRDPKILNPLL